MERDYPLHEDINFIPKEDELPSPDALISREFIQRFCDKEGWKLPDFWFRELPTGPSFPGRPSVMSAIAQRLEEIAESGNLADTLAEQSRQLSVWAAKRFSGSQTPTPRTVENGIRSAYNILKRAAVENEG